MTNKPEFELNATYIWDGFAAATTVREFKVVEIHGGDTVTIQVIRALDPQFNGERMIWRADWALQSAKTSK